MDHITQLLLGIRHAVSSEERGGLVAQLAEQAEIGNLSACFNYGFLLLEQGEKELAFSMFGKASDGGHLSARFNYAQCLHKGMGCEKDVERSRQLFEICALEHGMPHAYYMLGRIYRETDSEKAFEMYSRGAERGHLPSKLNLAAMFFYGEGVVQDLPRALQLYKAAADQGNATAQYNYSVMKLTGKGCTKNKAESLVYLRLAAQQSYPSALHGLALHYQRGDGVAKDLNRARRLYYAAAHRDHKKSQFQLAKIYEHGLGVEKDPQLAYEWYGRSLH